MKVVGNSPRGSGTPEINPLLRLCSVQNNCCTLRWWDKKTRSFSSSLCDFAGDFAGNFEGAVWVRAVRGGKEVNGGDRRGVEVEWVHGEYEESTSGVASLSSSREAVVVGVTTGSWLNESSERAEWESDVKAE